jgi:hypothetical protein
MPCALFRFADVRRWPYAAELLGFQFADVRLRPYVTVGVAKGVAKEIGRTHFLSQVAQFTGVRPLLTGGVFYDDPRAQYIKTRHDPEVEA